MGLAPLYETKRRQVARILRLAFDRFQRLSLPASGCTQSAFAHALQTVHSHPAHDAAAQEENDVHADLATKRNGYGEVGDAGRGDSNCYGQ